MFPNHDTATQEVATAPGDLPYAAISARVASQRGQFRHDNTTYPIAPAPHQDVAVLAVSGEQVPLRVATVFYTTDGSLPTQASPAVAMARAEMEWNLHAGYLTRWRAVLPGQTAGTVVRYRIGGWTDEAGAGPVVWAHDGLGFWYARPGEITTFAYHVEPPGPLLPAWASDGVFYHIFLDRFHPGTPDGQFAPKSGPRALHGGTLRGVWQALPYLSDLGVSVLWLSPLCAAETYHRYDTTDYFAIDPRLGTADDLRELVSAAHERGMRVIMDAVPSHCSWHHPAFLAAQADRSVPSASWFMFSDWPTHYRSFLNVVPSLPSINADDPAARQHLIDSFVMWVRDYGIDGFRLDHAIGVSMDFWIALRAALQAERPDCLTTGEVTDSPDACLAYRHRLDSVLDFKLAGALRMTFALQTWSLSDLDNFLVAYGRYMENGPGRLSFLDNHDMDRFLALAGDDRAALKLAALCHLTLEPPPIIYYGTEVGLSQQALCAVAGDTEARHDMPWDEARWDTDLLSFYRALVTLRRSSLALRQGQRTTVHLDDATATYAYLRAVAPIPGVSAGERLAVLCNRGQAECVIALPDGVTTMVLATQPGVQISEAHVLLPARSGAIVRLRV